MSNPRPDHTLMLLPGLLCDDAVWAAIVPALAPLASVRIADFSWQDSIAAMAHDVLAQNAGPLIVVGHSMGGRVALEATRTAPDRVIGLVLMDTGIHPRREAEVAQRGELVALAHAQGMTALADRWLPPMIHPNRLDDPALMAALYAMVERATPDRHERQIRALLDRPDAVQALGAIRCPTLVMVGREDRWSPVAQHEEIVAQVPGAQLVVIENSGHMLPMEQPEGTAAALVAWLRTLLAADPRPGRTRDGAVS